MLYYNAPAWLIVVSFAVLAGLILYQFMNRKVKLLTRQDDGNRKDTQP